jgi:hypothetical protein
MIIKETPNIIAPINMDYENLVILKVFESYQGKYNKETTLRVPSIPK